MSEWILADLNDVKAMKKTIFFLFVMLLFCSNVQRSLAQVPKQIVYQVMVLDPETHCAMPNQDVKVRIEIRKGSTSGIAVYAQDYDAHTNAAGSCFLSVDVNNNVDWTSDTYYFATLVNGELSGCSKITSLPQ
jgi:hypothetical protein